VDGKEEMKKIFKTILKICIFILIANLPFLTLAHITSMDTFLDSFENPEDYICLNSNSKLLHSTNTKEGYLIIQKTSHPDFKIEESDTIIYIKKEGGLACSRVYHYSYIGPTKKYFTDNTDDKISFNPVYEPQIVGKVVKIVDNNIWNSISIKIWDISIHDLNLHSYL